MKNSNYIDRMWNFFLNQQIEKLHHDSANSPENLQTYLRKTRIIEIKDNEIIVDAHNLKVIAFLKEKRIIREFLVKIQGEEKKITFRQNGILENSKSEIDLSINAIKPKQKIVLNPDEKVIIGEFNRKIIEMIERTLNGEKVWSPIFIYSVPGLGKTSILKLVKSALFENKICYIPALEFITGFFEKLTLSVHDIEKWKKKFTQYEIFLFDDVHLFSNKKKTNEVLFQIVNHAIQNEKIIIFTAETHPKNFIGFEKRLLSRFQKGLILEIRKPDLLASTKIIRQKSQMFCPKMQLTDEAIRTIANHFSHDIRKLEGIIKRIAFQWEFEGLEDSPVSLTFIAQIFGEKNWTKPQQLTGKQIFQVVANYYNLDPKDLTSRRKKQTLVFVRYIAMYLIQKLTSLSCEKIVKIFNIKSHSTVWSAVKKINDLQQKNKTVAKDLKILNKKCQNINKG